VNLAFVILGALAALLGLVLLVAGIRGHAGDSPKATVKLIAGMMLAAFGLLIAGFAIGYSRAEPLEFAQ
jgi:uncharacterized membrane protein